MTREEAVDRLKEARAGHKVYLSVETLNMAIEALQKEPCEDAISRQAVLEIAKSSKSNWIDNSVLFKKVDALPSVTPQPKTGHWLNVGDRTDWYDTVYRCSCCGREIIMPYELKNNLCSDYPYCHCGAKMVEPQESEVSE